MSAKPSGGLLRFPDVRMGGMLAVSCERYVRRSLGSFVGGVRSASFAIEAVPRLLPLSRPLQTGRSL